MLLPLSGLTPDHLFDRHYGSASGDVTNGVFNGFTGTRILFDTNSNSWKIVLLNDPDIYAQTESTNVWKDREPPLGTTRLYPSAKLGGSQFDINMNACDDETEYNCLGGTCIAIQDR